MSYEKIRQEKDLIKKKFAFLGWLNSELRARGKGTFPVLVGGSAIQYYTRGAYASMDIDVIWGDSQVITDILTPYGFKREGRYWYSDEDNLVLEAPSSYLEGRPSVVETELGPVHVISIEDIVLDRLDGYRWTNRKDDYLWAKVIFETGLKNSTPIDLAYLEAEAKERDIEPALKKLFSETNIEPPNEEITDDEEFDGGFGNR